MNNKFFLFLAIISIGFQGIAQDIVSGYISLDNYKDAEQKVHLSKVDLNDTDKSYSYTRIASTNLSEQGYFSFDQKWFTSKDHLYKIQLEPTEAATVNKQSKNSKLFILSKSDSIHFEKGPSAFETYTTNNKADKEWQQLKKFESKFESLHDDFDTDKYLLKTKGYIKDSLQILLVKLISIKKLDDKKLLDKDIMENTSYYTSLLKELKSSEIDPALFLYLENKLSLVYKEEAEQKYSVSMLLNGIAILIIGSLIFLVLRKRRKTQNTVITSSLSKQENTIKELILSGKTNKEIANELFISVNTVKTHISNIYSKLNIASRKELLVKNK